MKIEIKYTGGILNLPVKVADLAAIASEAQLKVLLTVASSLSSKTEEHTGNERV